MDNDLKFKVESAIKRLQDFAPKDGQYYLAFSGGKDSVVCKALCDMAGVKYDAHYRVTSVDPPELVKFIKDYHPDVSREIPRYKDGKPITMWNLIPKQKVMPTRIIRYCCKYLKEDGGDGRKTITGVRWAESTNRANSHGMVSIPKQFTKKNLGEELVSNGLTQKTKGYILTNDNDDARRFLETCYKRSKVMVNPIVDWSDRNVWDFIHEFNIPYCSLYDEGFHRLGCIGCPMARTNGRIRGFQRWPKYKRLYEYAMEKLIAIYHSPEYTGKMAWDNVKDMWNWWMEMEIPTNQIGFDEIEVEDDD